MKFLLKTIDTRYLRSNFVIFGVTSALTVAEWVVLVWSRNSYLGLAEVTSCVFLERKDARHDARVNSRFHLFVFDVNKRLMFPH